VSVKRRDGAGWTGSRPRTLSERCLRHYRALGEPDGLLTVVIGSPGWVPMPPSFVEFPAPCAGSGGGIRDDGEGAQAQKTSTSSEPLLSAVMGST
jgi:hypothetical protein